MTARDRTRHTAAAALALAGLLLSSVVPSRLGAQGNCTVNRTGTCEVGGTATFAMNLTISSVVRVSFPSSTIGLGTATAAEFAAGFGTPISVPVTVQANTGWALSISSPVSLWSAAPASARQNKPVGDLQWATAPGGPFTDLALASASVRAGGATALLTFPLYLRARYSFLLDSPGSYSLPVLFTVSAP